MTAREPLLVVIVGPTGSGKTALSLAIAEKFQGEIVNCDSVAVYREFEIGTAKPTAEERARAPHHLLDIVDPRDPFTAGDYARLAREKIAEISRRRHLPIVAGGTGLYLRALLEGLFEGPPRSEELRERLRAREREKGAGYLHRLLRRLDPEAAAGIHANDTPKLIRAIEVCVSARERMTDLWKRGRDPLRGYRVLKLGLNPERNALYTRLNARAAKMFDTGLIDETWRLLERYGDEARPLGSTGYAQVVQFLRGEIDRKLALWAAQQSHRNYAKRQITWFRREPAVEWLAGFGDEAEVQRQAASLIESMISLESIS
jgi:tRNA dimethylallyltransferase